MRCDVRYEELSRLVAGELSPERSRQLWEHIKTCSACRRRRHALEVTTVMLRALPKAMAPTHCILEAKRRLSNELRGRPLPEIMTLEEVADFLRVSPGQIDEVLAELPAFELAGEVRVRRSRLMEWIDGRERAYTRAVVESDVAHILARTV